MSDGVCHLMARWFWDNSWHAAILILLVLLVSRLFAKQLTAQARCLLWGLVVLRLAFPFSIPTPWSGLHLASISSYFKTPPLHEEGLPVPNVPQRANFKGNQSHQPEDAKWLPATESTLQNASATSRYADMSLAGFPEWNWKLILVWCWLAGTFYFAVCLVYQRRALNRLIAGGTPVADVNIQSLFAECLKIMPVRRVPRLVESTMLESPAVVGCVRPVLLLPSGLDKLFSEQELRHVFLHELGHVKRQDLWITWGVAFLEVLYWFNPVVRLGLRRVIAEREMACDALVLSCLDPKENVGYGRTILKLLEFLSRPATMPGMAGMLEGKQQIKRRMEMIVQHSIRARHPVALTLLVGGLAVFAFTDAKSQTLNAASTNDANVPVTKELLDQEKTVDAAHLKQIYAAIQAYYKDHQDLPNWLSDLVPQYLPDADVLVSPTEKRTKNPVLFGREDPKIHTSYIYEFNAGVAPEEFNKGKAPEEQWTCKYWKLQQIQRFGLITPILRCHVSTPVLNVAYAGDIFESGLLWEDDYRTLALLAKKPGLGPKAQAVKGPSMVIHVEDSETTLAVSGVKIYATRLSEYGLLQPIQAVTDENGNATINLGDWKINWLNINTEKEGYLGQGKDWNFKVSNDEKPAAEVSFSLLPKK